METVRISSCSPILDRTMKEKIICRSFASLYRLYLDSSLERRQWSPDRSFDWRSISTSHSEPLLRIIEGYYAVEQYTPDYTCELTKLFRENYGRSQFHLRWGAEEEKHADVWRNFLLVSGTKDSQTIEELTVTLRKQCWKPPTEDPIELILYVVLQERATQLIYLNTAALARGRSTDPSFAFDKDEVLEAIALKIAADEAAHYRFFLNGARLFLYYYPEETIKAIITVLHSFVMPAAKLVVNYESFVRDLYAAKIFGKGMYLKDVVGIALDKLGVTDIGAIESAVVQSRQSQEAIKMGILKGIQYSVVERSIKDLFCKIEEYENEVGLAVPGRTCFVQNTW